MVTSIAPVAVLKQETLVIESNTINIESVGSTTFTLIVFVQEALVASATITV